MQTLKEKEEIEQSIGVNVQEQEEYDHISKSYYICFILYTLQGAVVSIGVTMPYLYPTLPPYTTLALFNMQDFPFSFKFIISPFLQKYTHLDYGKRKTWIILSQLICFFLLMVGARYTSVAEAHFLALILVATVLFITIQDISLDSLAIKEIKSPEQASIVQSVAYSFGTVVGSLILLKFTSLEFAHKIGLQKAITTPQTMIECIAIFLLVSSLLLHFCFTETDLQCERRGKEKSICEIVAYSTTFLNIESKYCRLGILLLFYYQGFNFYEAGYDYEMVKAGFSRDTSNTVSNVVAAIVVMLTFRITRWISKNGINSSLRIILLFQCAVYLFNIVVFSQSSWVYSITQFLSQTLIAGQSMGLYIIIYSFPLHGFTGMFITFLLSIWNFGTLRTFPTLIISIFGWRVCSLLGILIELIVIWKLDSLIEWIEQGVIEIDSSILDEQNSIYSAEEKTGLSTFVRESEELTY